MNFLLQKGWNEPFEIKSESKMLLAIDSLFHVHLFWWKYVQISDRVYPGTWETLHPEQPDCLQAYEGSCLTDVTATSKGQLFWRRLEAVQLQIPSFCLLFLLYFTSACLLDLRDNEVI